MQPVLQGTLLLTGIVPATGCGVAGTLQGAKRLCTVIKHKIGSPKSLCPVGCLYRLYGVHYRPDMMFTVENLQERSYKLRYIM